MSKHTPGPWTLDEDTYTIASSSSLIVASVCTVDDYSDPEEEYRAQLVEQCAANARLIAASPDLAEALDRALDAIHQIYDEWGRETGKDAKRLYDEDPAVVAGRAALAKARGEGEEAALITEYIEVHGYSLEDAIAAAAREMAEGAAVEDSDFLPIE